MSGEFDHIASDEISVLRDVQMAQEIRSLAALGVFPKGILVYGLVYYQNNQRQYMISTDPAKLITFLNDVENCKYFPTPMESYSESLIIPEGEEEDVINSVKVKLARILQKKYPAEVFVILKALNSATGNNTMDAPLLAYREEMESIFDIDKIKAFRDLCTRAYLRNCVSATVYRQLLAWSDHRLARLADYLPPMGRKEKVFYGMAILEGQKISRCIINANLSCIYQEKCKLEQQGYYITSWHEKIFTMEHQESLRGVNQQMTEFLQNIYDTSMIQLIETLEQSPMMIASEDMQKALEILSLYGTDAEALGRYYGHMWGAVSFTAEKENSHAISK